MPLIYKGLFPSISTFETPPSNAIDSTASEVVCATAYRHRVTFAALRLDTRNHLTLTIVYVAAVPYAHHKDYEPLIFNAADHPIIPDTVSPESCKGRC